MQNKCNCSCQNNFVPVNGNWDFNCCDQYQQNHVRRNSCGNDGCDECGQNYNRSRNHDDCQRDRCDDDRQVGCCDKNTYVREMEDDCECKGKRSVNRQRSCTGCDDCQCDECVRNRCRKGRNNGCGKDCDDCGEAACKGRRSDNCGCKNKDDNASTYARSGKNRKVGMINVAKQEIDEIFESESGLRAGTLFPELHKPMNGYCPCDKNCGTCKQAAAFAAWELRLYLNTHPNDKEALELFRKLCKEAADENYATTFLTDDCCASGWNWIKNPWPWEYDCNCGD